VAGTMRFLFFRNEEPKQKNPFPQQPLCSICPQPAPSKKLSEHISYLKKSAVHHEPINLEYKEKNNFI
jgi:hypothetical protein